MAMAYSLLISGLLSQVINSWPNRKLLNYSYFEQFKDILPSIIAAVLMGGIIYPICYLAVPDIVILVIQIVLGLAVYIGLSVVFKIDSFYYIIRFAKSTLGKRKNDT